MAGEDKLKQDIREIVHEVVDPQFIKVDSRFNKIDDRLDTVDGQLKEILNRLPPASPKPPSPPAAPALSGPSVAAAATRTKAKP